MVEHNLPYALVSLVHKDTQKYVLHLKTFRAVSGEEETWRENAHYYADMMRFGVEDTNFEIIVEETWRKDD